MVVCTAVGTMGVRVGAGGNQCWCGEFWLRLKVERIPALSKLLEKLSLFLLSTSTLFCVAELESSVFLYSDIVCWYYQIYCVTEALLCGLALSLLGLLFAGDRIPNKNPPEDSTDHLRESLELIVAEERLIIRA